MNLKTSELRKDHDLVILYSGGADSTILLKMAERVGRNPIALMIDYNQLHLAELDFAKKFLDTNNIENMTIKISGFDVNSALTGTGEKGIYKGVDIHNVPGRNSIFLSLAYGIAESRGIQEIWFGANWEDYEHLFPDCTQQYIGRMNKVLEISGVKPIKVYAPLLGMQKDLIYQLLENDYKIKRDEIYSGYGEFK